MRYHLSKCELFSSLSGTFVRCVAAFRTAADSRRVQAACFFTATKYVDAATRRVV